MNKKTLFLILLAVLALPSLAFADTPTLGGMALAAANTVRYVGSIIVIIMWVVTGILFLTATGDPAKLTTAKKGLFAAIAGTVLIIVAWYATDLVGNAFGLTA